MALTHRAIKGFHQITLFTGKKILEFPALGQEVLCIGCLDIDLQLLGQILKLPIQAVFVGQEIFYTGKFLGFQQMPEIVGNGL
jgi:hypothetical protein